MRTCGSAFTSGSRSTHASDPRNRDPRKSVVTGDFSRAARAARREERERQRRAAELEDELDPPPKLGPSIRDLLTTATNVVHTRLALAGLELEEEIQRLLAAAAITLGALVFLFLGLLVATLAIVAAVDPDHRLIALIILMVVYFAIGAVGLFKVKALFELRPPIFGATFAELDKDKETLSQMIHAHRAAEASRARRPEE